jgi:hypothetical protein
MITTTTRLNVKDVHKQMTTRVYNRRHERIERLHDEQDTLLSKEDLDRCQELKANFNRDLEREQLVIPPYTSEAALLCFVYATKRVGEKPIVKDGLVVIFPSSQTTIIE